MSRCDSDEEEDEKIQTRYNPQPILEPKDLYGHRPLPHLIGTQDFYCDDLIGLGESESEEEAADDDEEEEESSESENESESSSSESEPSISESSESESNSDSDASKEKIKKSKPKKKEIEFSSSEEDEDLFGEKKTKRKEDEENDEDEEESEEEKPAKPQALGFAAELAAKIGVAPPAQARDSDEDEEEHGAFSDEETPIPPQQTPEKKRTESRASTGSKTKKEKHHHHHKKAHLGTKYSHKGHDRKRHDSKTSKASANDDDLFAQPSTEDDGLFGTEGSPFSKKGGLFSSGGGLFDDNEAKDGDLFGEDKGETSSIKEAPDQEEEEVVSVIKPRARSTASGKKLPAGAVSIFGDGVLSGSLTSESSIPDDKLTKKASKQEQGLFDEDDDEGLFGAEKKAQELPKSKKPSKPVDLFGGEEEEDEEDDGLFSSMSKVQPSRAAPKKKIPAGAVSLFGGQEPTLNKAQPSKPPPDQQASKSKSGGGLFSDEDEEESGGLFSSSASQPKTSKVEPQTKPKSKTTVSLFDDDEKDDDDFFSASKPSAPAKNPNNSAEAEKSKKPAAKVSGLFDDGDDDDDAASFDSPAPTRKAPPASSSTPKQDIKKIQPKSSKMPSLFSDEEDGGMFGGNAEDIFESASPPKVTKSTVPAKKMANQKPSLFSDGEDDLFSRQPTENKTKTKPGEKKDQQPSSSQKASLFSDGEDDLFSGTSTGQTILKEKKEVAEEENKKSWKPVGGVSLFGGVDLFSGKKPSFTEEEEIMKDAKPNQATIEVKTSEPKPKTAAPLIDNETDDDDFFSKPQPPPLSTSPIPQPTKAKLGPSLFSDDDEDLFSDSKPKTTSAAVKEMEEPPAVTEKLKPKKPVGAVSLFGGVDLFGGAPAKGGEKKSNDAVATTKKKDPLGMLDDNDGEDLFASKPKQVSPPLSIPVSPSKAGSSVDKLQKSLAFHPAMLRPGAGPPSRRETSETASFDEPAVAKTLENVGKERAKVQVKRRPPTRQARRAAASASASDDTLFGSALGGESAPVPQPAITSMDDSYVTRIQVDAMSDLPEVVQNKQRKETRDSDMSDEFFGFASSTSPKAPKPNSSDATFSSNTSVNDSNDFFVPLGNKTEKSKASKNSLVDRDDLVTTPISGSKSKGKTIADDFDLFADDSKPKSTGISNETVESKTVERVKPSVSEDKSKKSLLDNAQDDLFGAGLSGTKTKIRSPVDDNDLFVSSESKVQKSKEKLNAEDKITSGIDDSRFSSVPTEENVKPKTPLNDNDIFSTLPAKDQKPKETNLQQETKEKPSVSLLDEDDLFGGPVVKKKEQTKEMTKKEEGEERTFSQGKKPLDDDDDKLFNVTRKPKKVVKPLGDDDLFGNSGNIFADVPSKPKDKKKKKQAAAVTGESIFDEKTPKKTKPKRKSGEKKPAKTTSIFDDDAPSIFDDPLNATSSK